MRQKLLIIDDSAMIHTLVTMRLADEPIEVFTALSGDEGIARAVELQPDLILLDVDLPRMDGFAVCRELKNRSETMAIPIVFLTGVSSSEEKIRGLDLGAVDYITKPFDPAELRARVRATLRTKYLLDLLSKKAQIDGLTGLWNRGYFDQRLVRERSLATRTGDALAVMMVDIDHFKSINDRFGHPAGDEVIRRVAQCLMKCVRLEDVVCRYGGEEFAVLMPNTSEPLAAIVAERIRRAIEKETITFAGKAINATASFGVGPVVDDLSVRHADAALYAAKAAGRNRISQVSAGEPSKSAA